MNVWRTCAWRKCFALAIFIFIAAGLWPEAGKVSAKPIKILALGNSLVAGYGLGKADSFIGQLKRAFRADGLEILLINGGVSGDTSAGGRARLDWALSDKPDAVIVELGANDGLRGLEPSETERNLDAIIAKVTSRGIPVLLSGMRAPPNFGVEYASEFNAIYPRIAKRYGVLFDPFFLAGVATVPSLNQADGIHPNKEGVAVIIKRLMPMLRDLADQSKKNKGSRRMQ